ncbi:serine hydrolase domain-containing protein [Virgibacillus sp. MSJ-26]|uniref:serine hydrolase domain-containing protein n=1 Tax=Virgibacillus sp. MSJ-26 TaxID=2841522 RepID=UPI003530230A
MELRRRIIPIMYAFVLVFTMLSVQPQATQAEILGLQPDSPENVEMLQQPLDDLDGEIEEAISEKVMPGAVVLIARDGKVVKHDAYGYAARYVDDDFTEMDEPIEMHEDTIFDMASISKLFTAVAVMQLWDQGHFDLDDVVADYLPEYDTEEKEEITIKQLLTHTSGEKAGPSQPLYDIEGTRADLLDFTMAEPLLNEPGAEYVYSDINYITLGVLIERLTGERQDAYVEENIIEPLGMGDTMYNPSEDLKSRIAATEEQPWADRGLVWGSVHDEKAWALDGVAGHAGVFSSASDMAVFLQMLLNEGSYQEVDILSDEAFNLMNINWNTDYPGQDHGLGWDLNQDWYMDVLAEENTFGHTGYTGTSVVASPDLDTMAILLTNRVHPTRETVSTNSIRKKTSSLTANAIYAWDAKNMQRLVESLNKKEEFKDETVARSLSLHLKAVEHYENTGHSEKVRKHLAGFNSLIEYHLENEAISEEVYETLLSHSDYLVNQWK